MFRLLRRCPLVARLHWLLAVTALLLHGGPVRAESAVSEAELKVAYLFNFAKFAEWPTVSLAPGAPITICSVGKDAFGDALTHLETKSVQGHAVKVRRGLRVEELRGCHLAYFGAGEERMWADAVRTAESQAILTLGDTDGFVDQGGMIGLAKRDNRITFDVNVEAAHRAGIRLSSQVLKLARTVRGKTP